MYLHTFALSRITRDMAEMCRVYRIPFRTKLLKIYLPAAALPEITVGAVDHAHEALAVESQRIDLRRGFEGGIALPRSGYVEVGVDTAHPVEQFEQLRIGFWTGYVDDGRMDTLRRQRSQPFEFLCPPAAYTDHISARYEAFGNGTAYARGCTHDYDTFHCHMVFCWF